MRIRIELSEEALWRQFSLHQNEMIITKAGRCLFPLYRVKLVEDPQGSLEIDPDAFYCVALSIEPFDEHKWKWRQGRWTPLISSGMAALEERSRPLVIHEKMVGSLLVEQDLNFDKLKLSNRQSNGGNSVICLHSFRHYIPVVSLENLDDPADTLRIRIPETNFIAVTHYQNDQVTLLKKSYNPHAKGFVINEATPTSGTSSWMLTPERTSPTDSRKSDPHHNHHHRGRKTRKRIRPVTSSDLLAGTTDSIPSDEEELQGSIALQMLGTKGSDE